MSLINTNVPAGEITIGDILIDDGWHDSALWGQKVTDVTITDDALSHQSGRLVQIKLTGHCGLTTREHQKLEVLR